MNSEADAIKSVVVGSIGIDTIETTTEKREEILGGSVSYACAAASFFGRTAMVGVVGSDFPEEYRSLYERFGIDLEGLQTREGRTFRWSGVYDDDMVNRKTLTTELNVFEDLNPELPERYRDVPFLLLGNIMPDLQLHVLEQANRPLFVVADTMDLWINTERKALEKVIGRVNMLTLNDSEARMLTGQHHLRKAADEIRAMGPDYVVIKKGEHGAMLVSSEGVFLAPAYPVYEVVDPTGAGDSFAGGFMGHLAREGKVDEWVVREALLMGSIVASCGVEKFSLDGLVELTLDEINARRDELSGMMKLKQ